MIQKTTVDGAEYRVVLYFPSGEISYPSSRVEYLRDLTRSSMEALGTGKVKVYKGDRELNITRFCIQHLGGD